MVIIEDTREKEEKRSKKKEEGFSRRGGCRGCVRAQAEDVIETSTSTVNTGGGPVGGGNAYDAWRSVDPPTRVGGSVTTPSRHHSKEGVGRVSRGTDMDVVGVALPTRVRTHAQQAHVLTA